MTDGIDWMCWPGGQEEPGKKVAAIVQVADEALRAQLETERDILALLGRYVRSAHPRS